MCIHICLHIYVCVYVGINIQSNLSVFIVSVYNMLLVLTTVYGITIKEKSEKGEANSPFYNSHYLPMILSRGRILCMM